MKRIYLWLRVIFYFFLSLRGSKAPILSGDETVDYVKNNHLSLIRFGDGEFGIYKGRGISYQEWSKALKDKFEEIKKAYDGDGANSFVLCVPRKYLTISGFKLLKKRKLVASWSESRSFFKKHFNQKALYGDAFLFRKGNERIYEKIWCDGFYEAFIFIHRDCSYAQSFAEKYKKEVFYVKCPDYS